MDAPQLGAWPVVAHAFALCYGLCVQALLYTRVWAWAPACNYLANTSIVNNQQRVWLAVRYESTATAMRVYVVSPTYNAMVQSLHVAGYLLNTLVAWCVCVKQGLYNGQKERHAKACNRAEQTDTPCIPDGCQKLATSLRFCA